MPDDKKQGFSFDSIFSSFDSLTELPESDFDMPDTPVQSDPLEDVDFDFDVPKVEDEDVTEELEEDDIDVDGAEPEGGDEGDDGDSEED